MVVGTEDENAGAERFELFLDSADFANEIALDEFSEFSEAFGYGVL